MCLDCLLALPKPGEGPFRGWFALLNFTITVAIEIHLYCKYAIW